MKYLNIFLGVSLLCTQTLTSCSNDNEDDILNPKQNVEDTIMTITVGAPTISTDQTGSGTRVALNQVVTGTGIWV